MSTIQNWLEHTYYHSENLSRPSSVGDVASATGNSTSTFTHACPEDELATEQLRSARQRVREPCLSEK